MKRSKEDMIPVSKVIDALNRYSEFVIVTIDPTHALKYMAATNEDATTTVAMIRERKAHLEFMKRSKKSAADLAPWIVLLFAMVIAGILIYMFFIQNGPSAHPQPAQVVTTPSPQPQGGGLKI